MDKRYDPEAIQDKWYESWESSGYFAPSNAQEPYSIVLPPPNVTGTLHMGHGFQVTLMDVLVRMHRMRGHSVLWQGGSDHAGISTQVVVERLLEQEGSSKNALGRDDFIERVWEWKHKSGDSITRQLRRLGASLDWDSERFTMDEVMSKAVIEVFVRLYRDDLIYRGTRLVNWDSQLQSALSDLEVNSVEEQGTLWHIAYPLEGSEDTLVVATTRPETMLGDSAVAVHPEDERYRHLIGAQVRLPLTDRLIPVIADDYVEPEFGSGCVKITPAHDFNDYEMGERHQLECINILQTDGTLNEQVPERWRGMSTQQARAEVLDALRELGCLVGEEAHVSKIPRSDRTGVVVEPLLTTQWYVAVESMAKKAITVVEDGEVTFIPKNWENTYFAWMRDIRDWCISRQLWWGHRIPAWYDDSGEVYVGHSEDEVRAHYSLDSGVTLRQDEDVLDTWFSSGLWSFATQGWPQDTERLQKFSPTSVLVTGFDIIFFWVARMIMLSLYCTGKVPFREVYIHGLIRDEQGQKMSKSKGNVLDPIDLIDGIDLESLVAKRTHGVLLSDHAKTIASSTRKQFPDGIVGCGVDALRFTYCSLAGTGRDINFDSKRLEGYRNFCNKLWNAARYVESATDSIELNPDAAGSCADRWIVSQLQRTERAVNEALDAYRFDLASQALYEFVWNHYCDWYVELSKVALQDDDAGARSKTAYTLVSVLETVLRLAHPFIPFLTEEIWQQVAPRLQRAGCESLMLASYPQADDALLDVEAERETLWLREVISSVRTVRSEINIAFSRPVGLLVDAPIDSDARVLVERHRGFIAKLVNAHSLEWLQADTSEPPSAAQMVGDMRILVPLEGLVEPGVEQARLQKRLEQIEGEVKSLEKRLANEGFRAKAPEELVAACEAQMLEAVAKRDEVQGNLQVMRQLLTGGS